MVKPFTLTLLLSLLGEESVAPKPSGGACRKARPDYRRISMLRGSHGERRDKATGACLRALVLNRMDNGLLSAAPAVHPEVGSCPNRGEGR